MAFLSWHMADALQFMNVHPFIHDLHPILPSELGGINDIAGLGNGVLPNVSEEKVWPTRAWNMKDFENLGWQVDWLASKIRGFSISVEVESLKQKLQERDQLLISASKAVESLAEGGGSEVQRVKEDARRKVQQVEDLLMERIHLLEEVSLELPRGLYLQDVKAAQAELEKAFAETETEKAFRLSLESKLSTMKKMQERDLELTLALEDKDRLIEELKLSLKSKEALIQCLQEEKSQMASPDENVSSGELRGLSATLREAKERDAEAAQRAWQMERNHWEEKIQRYVHMSVVPVEARRL
uniref:CDK5 regulatory subunit-associated protein 2-like n=1 Tax=Myodes glareolus TaxID=447135 RepID=UPI002022250C|nr:CDK5 regulatory subunit-associated protein 2-like [Myodes glareolus]